MHDPVHDRIAQVEVRVVHVDLRPQGAAALGELARLHSPEEIEVFLHRAVPVGAFLPAPDVAAVLRHLLGRQVIDVGFAVANELLGPLVELVEVVGGVELAPFPVGAEPADVFADGIDVLLLLGGGVGVVVAQVELPAILHGQSIVEADRFRVPQVQVAVRLRWEPGVDASAEPPALVVFFDDFLDEVQARRVGLVTLLRRLGHEFPRWSSASNSRNQCELNPCVPERASRVFANDGHSPWKNRTWRMPEQNWEGLLFLLPGKADDYHCTAFARHFSYPAASLISRNGIATSIIFFGVVRSFSPALSPLGRLRSCRLWHFDGGLFAPSAWAISVELVKFGLKEPLVRQFGLVFGNQGRRNRSAQGVLDDFLILRGAQNDADRRSFVGLADVAVEGFKVELHLPEVLGLELFNFEIDRDQAVESAMKEQQIDKEVAIADLKWIITADKAEIAAEFDQKLLELFDQRPLQFAFGMFGRKLQKFEQVSILENRRGFGVNFSHHRCEFWRREYGALEQRPIQLTLQIPLSPFFSDAHSKIKLSFLIEFAAAHDEQVVGPAQFCHQW